MNQLIDLALRRALDALPIDDLVAVAAGYARIEVHPIDAAGTDPAQLGLYAAPATPPIAPSRPRRSPVTPVPARDHGIDVAAAVTRINELSTPAAVDEYLQDPRFTAPLLKQVARALGPTVLATGRSKGELRRDIVAGTVGFRSRSAAMSGGAWS